MNLIGCRVNGCQNQGLAESEYDLHHLIPKSIGGTDADGRTYLCKKHHDIIHLLLLKQVFKYVPDDKKDECRQHIKKFTEWYIKKG